MVRKIISVGLVFIMILSLWGCGGGEIVNEHCCPQYGHEHNFCLTFEISHTDFRRSEASNVMITVTLKNLSGESHYIKYNYLFVFSTERGMLWGYEGGGISESNSSAMQFGGADIWQPESTTRYFEKGSIIQFERNFSEEFRRTGRIELRLHARFSTNFGIEDGVVNLGENIIIFAHRITINIRR